MVPSHHLLQYEWWDDDEGTFAKLGPAVNCGESKFVISQGSPEKNNFIYDTKILSDSRMKLLFE